MKTSKIRTTLALFLPAVAMPVSTPLGYESYAKLFARLEGGQTAANLTDVLPNFPKDLETAAKVSDSHWTDSTPYDELAHGYVLPDAIMDALGIRHEVTGSLAHASAGLLHSYGYLFSQLKTAYGLKGKRWIESRLDERLGLPAGTFSPRPPRGEFLSNLTAVLMHLVGAPVHLPRSSVLEPQARTAGQITERLKWRTLEGGIVSSTVITHLVPLAPLPSFETSDTHLLIYEVVHAHKHRLVTAFPIDQRFAQSLLGAKPAVDATFQPRFNLYVDPSWTVIERRSSGYLPAR